MSAPPPSDAGPIFLVAPDKFKGTLTAPQAAAAIAEGLHAAAPTARIRMLPFADGGEGTVDAVLAAGGERRVATVTGPLGDPVDAVWALLPATGAGGRPTAVLESAAANGLALVTPTRETALDASSAGVGDLVRAALDADAGRIVIGLGGSASTDGGAGALRALGARPLDADGSPVQGGGRELARIATLDLVGLDPRIRTAEIVLASDVANPLSGPSGAARIFAPQKGADAAAVERLDAGLASWGEVLRTATGVDLAHAGDGATPWGGAAGGLGGGLVAALRARPGAGVDVLAELLEFDAALDGVALLVVGEGAIDVQSAMGKAPVGLARRARERGIRTIAVVGRSDLPSTALAADGIDRIVSATDAGGVDALIAPARWVAEAAYRALTGRQLLRAPRPTVPVRPTPYFHFLRTPRNSWWRSLLMILAVTAAFAIASLVLFLPAILIDLISGRTTPADYQPGHIRFTPLLFLANNLSLASLILVSYLLQWAITRQRPRWLSSVAGRFRWRWFAISLGIVIPIWVLYLGLDALLSGGIDAAKLSPDWLFMIVAVALTTPLQSAGEEFAFRGVLVRGIASWIPRRWLGWTVGTAVSSVVFMFAHLAADPWLNVFYISFGIAMSALAWWTGGLEAGIAIHAVNNTLALIPIALFADIDSAFTRTDGSGSPLGLIQVGVVAVVVVLIALLARRRGLARLGPPRG